MSFTYTYTHTETNFIAGEHAPSVRDVHDGKQIVNNYDNIALGPIKPNPAVEASVVYDLGAEPPAVHFNRALARTAFGYVDGGGNFVAHEHGIQGGVHEVTGTYTGAGSTLRMR
jgi:hypothetical protein